MKHSENTLENALKADAFAQQMISNLTATLQRFNELQTQIQALQTTQKTSNVSFILLITPLSLSALIVTASPVYAFLDPQAMITTAQTMAQTIQN